METHQAAQVTKPSVDAVNAVSFGSVFESMLTADALQALCEAHAPVARTPPKLGRV